VKGNGTKVIAGARVELGRKSENIVVEWLQARGYRIVDRNWRNRYGELDIVAIKDEVWVVEVRSRKFRNVEIGDAVGSVSETVTRLKLKHLRSAGYAWCRQKGYTVDSLSIQLIVVTWYNSGRFRVEEVPVY
jgi:putative endonuclease